MKLHLLSLIAGVLCLTACDNNDNSPAPNEAVTKAFTAKYPSASRVEWEYKGSYITAEFIYDKFSTTAWFDNTGQWFMTETELRNINQLPEAVLTAFKASEYATWSTDDVDRLERLDTETIYVIEVKNGRQEFDLIYSEDGILIKAIPDTDNDDYDEYLPDINPAPTAITEYINANYPDARIIEIDNEHGMTEVDIIHNNRSKEVVFNSKQEWVNTHYDVSQNEVEEIVLQALAASQYGNYHIDDIEKYETLAGDYYLFELERGEHEVKMKIDLNGNII